MVRNPRQILHDETHIKFVKNMKQILVCFLFTVKHGSKVVFCSNAGKIKLLYSSIKISFKGLTLRVYYATVLSKSIK